MLTALRPGLFDGTTVLITGGGSGIGLTTALLMGGLGAQVALCGRRSEPLERAAAQLDERDISVFTGICDIREPEAIETFVDGVIERFGGVQVLVNNAGGQYPSPAKLISPKGFAAVVRNNLVGTWNMIHSVANKAMLDEGGGGCIINIIAQIKRGFPGMAHTGAARAGVDNLTKTLAVEWASEGVRVNAIAPGIIKSTGTERYPPELLELGRKATPAKRLGTPEEVAELIAFLSSPTADFITGQTVYIDGGQSLWGDLWEID